MEHVTLGGDADALRWQADLLDGVDEQSRHLANIQQKYHEAVAGRFPDFTPDRDPVQLFSETDEDAVDHSLEGDEASLVEIFNRYVEPAPLFDPPTELRDQQQSYAEQWAATARRDLVASPSESNVTLYPDDEGVFLLDNVRLGTVVRPRQGQSFRVSPNAAPGLVGKPMALSTDQLAHRTRLGNFRGVSSPVGVISAEHVMTPEWFAVQGATRITGPLEFWVELECDEAKTVSFVGGLPGETTPDLALASAMSSLIFRDMTPGADPTVVGATTLWSHEDFWFRLGNKPFAGAVTDHSSKVPKWVHIRARMNATIAFDGSKSSIASIGIGLFDVLRVSDPATTASFISLTQRIRVKQVIVNILR